MRAAIYVRVSTEEQHLTHQRAELRREVARRGWKLVREYAEKASGVSVRRPELERLRHDGAMNFFNVLLVWSIDRVGRNALEVLQLAEELFDRKVALVSLREPAVDLTNPMGRLVLEIGAAFAGFERRRLSERTKAGLAGARARGAALGRPPKASAQQIRHIVGMCEGNQARAARQLGVHVRTVARAMTKTGARK